jgi:hypothetical protein
MSSLLPTERVQAQPFTMKTVGALTLSLYVLVIPMLLMCSCQDKSAICRDETCLQAHCAGGEEDFECSSTTQCKEIVCEGVLWICAADTSKSYFWSKTSVSCNDQDPLTKNDHCHGGICKGDPIKTTKDPRCKDETTLVVTTKDEPCPGDACKEIETEYVCTNRCDTMVNRCVSDTCTNNACDSPPCYEGHCFETYCAYLSKPAGTECFSTDACMTNTHCDENHKCVGQPMDCTKPNAKTECKQGECIITGCETGFENCDQKQKNGCEVDINGNKENCGECGKTCKDRAQATGQCVNGTCTLQCNGNYKDCDNNYDNGCEIPEGVANSCSERGLASSGDPCGTAYCGFSFSSDVKLFGTWYCSFCLHCFKNHDDIFGCVWHPDGEGLFYNVSGSCPQPEKDKVCPK